MSKINNNFEHSMTKKESRKIIHEDLRQLSIEWKSNMQKIKLNRKKRSELIREDRNNQKQYQKEIRIFEKSDLKNKKSRINSVKEWYTNIEKSKSNKFIYKYKKSQSKNVNYDFSGDVVFENVTYTYSKNTPLEFNALRQANLTIKKGLITAIIGTTGSGKSTLIQLINGLIIAETGRTIIGNFQLPASTKKIKYVKPLRKEIGLVFQFPEYQLFQESIEKDIAFGPITMGVPKDEIMKKVPELLKMVDLPEDYVSRSPFALSGGQKRRVAIAGIIAMDGNTLVLDEPTGGLDPQGEEDFMRIFESLNKDKGKRIIIVTHNMDHVLKIADEVIVMHEGDVKKIGKPFEIFRDTKLLKLIDIQPPKLYQLAYKLKDKGVDLTQDEFRTIDDFVKLLKKKRGK